MLGMISDGMGEAPPKRRFEGLRRLLKCQLALCRMVLVHEGRVVYEEKKNRPPLELPCGKIYECPECGRQRYEPDYFEVIE